MKTQPTASVLSAIVETLALEVKAGVLPSTIAARIRNNGFAPELAEKVARLAEIEAGK